MTDNGCVDGDDAMGDQQQVISSLKDPCAVIISRPSLHEQQPQTHNLLVPTPQPAPMGMNSSKLKSRPRGYYDYKVNTSTRCPMQALEAGNSRCASDDSRPTPASPSASLTCAKNTTCNSNNNNNNSNNSVQQQPMDCRLGSISEEPHRGSCDPVAFTAHDDALEMLSPEMMMVTPAHGDRKETVQPHRSAKRERSESPSPKRTNKTRTQMSTHSGESSSLGAVSGTTVVLPAASAAGDPPPSPGSSSEDESMCGAEQCVPPYVLLSQVDAGDLEDAKARVLKEHRDKRCCCCCNPDVVVEVTERAEKLARAFARRQIPNWKTLSADEKNEKAFENLILGIMALADIMKEREEVRMRAKTQINELKTQINELTKEREEVRMRANTLARELAAKRKEREEERMEETKQLAEISNALAARRAQYDELAKAAIPNTAVVVWDGLRSDPGMLFYVHDDSCSVSVSDTPASSSSSSSSSTSSSVGAFVRVQTTEVGTWEDALVDIPAPCLLRRGTTWEFATLSLAVPTNETAIRMCFSMYLSDIIRAVKCMWDSDTMGVLPAVRFSVKSTTGTDVMGLQVDVCVTADGELLFPIEMQVTGKWLHTWELLADTLAKHPQLEAKYGQRSGPLSLAEIVMVERELAGREGTQSVRQNMQAPIAQVNACIALAGTRYGMLSTGEYTYLCRRTDQGALEARDVVRHREWNEAVDGEVPAQQMAHFLIHVLTADDAKMGAPLSPDVGVERDRNADEQREDRSKKRATKHDKNNKSSAGQQGSSSSSRPQPSEGQGKASKGQTVKQDGTGGFTFRGLKITASPGVDVYKALSLEYEKARGDTLIGHFRTGPAYRASFEDKAVVVKVAHTDKDKHLLTELKNEMRMYDKLSDLQGDVLPQLIYAGPMLAGRTAIATSDCGVPLSEWAETASAADLAMVGAEARHKLRKLHDAGVLHGDIKPLNVTVGHARKVSLIDLAFASELTGANAPEAEAERETLEAELRDMGV